MLGFFFFGVCFIFSPFSIVFALLCLPGVRHATLKRLLSPLPSPPLLQQAKCKRLIVVSHFFFFFLSFSLGLPEQVRLTASLVLLEAFSLAVPLVGAMNILTVKSLLI